MNNLGSSHTLYAGSAALLAGISREAMVRLIQRGEVYGWKEGRYYLTTRGQLHAWLERTGRPKPDSILGDSCCVFHGDVLMDASTDYREAEAMRDNTAGSYLRWLGREEVKSYRTVDYQSHDVEPRFGGV